MDVINYPWPTLIWTKLMNETSDSTIDTYVIVQYSSVCDVPNKWRTMKLWIHLILRYCVLYSLAPLLYEIS